MNESDLKWTHKLILNLLKELWNEKLTVLYYPA